MSRGHKQGNSPGATSFQGPLAGPRGGKLYFQTQSLELSRNIFQFSKMLRITIMVLFLRTTSQFKYAALQLQILECVACWHWYLENAGLPNVQCRLSIRKHPLGLCLHFRFCECFPIHSPCNCKWLQHKGMDVVMMFCLLVNCQCWPVIQLMLNDNNRPLRV